MSQTFNLVCHAKRKKIWIGQGWGSMTNFYSGMPDRMEHLKRFLNDTRGHALVLLCDDTQGGEWQDYEAAEESDLANASGEPAGNSAPKTDGPSEKCGT
jgi:hypothetical protein